MEYYEILDVPPDATAEQIRAAYRILVQLHHPDRLQQASPGVREYAEERLKKINEAYTVLSDPARRARYDAANKKAARSAEAAYYDVVVEEDWPAYASPRRTRTRRTTPAQEAYGAWVREQKEREAEARAAERAQRRAQEAERERREAEERARRAAEEQYPRVRVQGAQGEEMVLTFAPGLWTTLVRVPAGEFVMGGDPAHDPNAARHEQPQHRVCLSAFYISRYPVTNAQYQAFVAATYYHSPDAAAPWRTPPGKENHPVVNVTWDDAVAFCKWLKGVTGRLFRLPTEAEWEKAARGEDGRRYPWGGAWEAARLNGEGGQGDTTPVGQYSPGGDSPYGLADASGNVWEWCHDWYSHRAYEHRTRAVVQDPQGPPTGEGCVVRGGAFDSSPKQTRCAHRNWYYPYNARQNVGFRIAAT